MRIPALVLVLAAAGVSADDAMFWTYPQQVVAEFATEAAAQAATASLDMMPPGKKYAFSCRWDDTNWAHSKMAETLASQGFKATFYLTSVPSDYAKHIIPKLLGSGHSVGAHTLTHPMMPELLPNCAFIEVMQNRIEVETAGQTPVVAFNLPYCRFASDVDEECPHRLGQILFRSGLMGSSEYWEDMAAKYGLANDQWCASRNFSINDRNPEQSRFDKGVDGAIRDIDAGRFPGGPHFTLGTHSWQHDPDGFEKLKAIVSARANKPEFWYCNENEFTAARMQALHSRITKTGVKGATATFMIERVMPFQLGADENLTVRFSEPPVSVAGKTCGNVLCAIPNEAGQSVATLFLNLTNAVPNQLAIDFSVDGSGVVSGTVRNPSGASEYFLTLRPSVCWQKGVQRLRIPKAADASFRFELGPEETDPLYKGGPRLIALQCDYRSDGKQCRAYKTLTLPAEEAAPAGDEAYSAVFAGPFASGLADAAVLAALSEPASPTKAFGVGLCDQWYPTRHPAQNARFVMQAKGEGSAWEKAMRAIHPDKGAKFSVVYLIDFSVGKAGPRKILLSKGYRPVFYLDGVPFNPAKPVGLAAGKHRVLVADTFQDQYSSLSEGFRLKAE